MRERRGGVPDRLLCAGPGRLCQALGIDRRHDGLPLDEPPVELRAATISVAIVQGPRMSIAKARDMPWRFGLVGSVYLSRHFRD